MSTVLGGRSPGVAFGLSWDDAGKGRFMLVFMALLMTAALVAPPAAAPANPAALISVIIRELPGAGNGPEDTVKQLGGNVTRHLAIIDGFVAEVPADRIAELESTPGVHSVTVNYRVRLEGGEGFDVTNGGSSDSSTSLAAYDPATDPGSMYRVAQEVLGADAFWDAGLTGRGVDVALIDSGVVPVEGVTVAGKVVNGPDLSFESQASQLRYLDTYGHGTHLAGIIAGHDEGAVAGDPNAFLGIAPGVRLLSIKVADAVGAVDVSQVIAAIDWVVQNRDVGFDVRVLALAFGTDGIQDYRVDPLAYAVEVAWRKGIVVVAAAGNDGNAVERLRNPAYDPFVIAVGAADTNGTRDTADDAVTPFSACGNDSRHVDLVAPGKSLVSLRAAGSNADLQHPSARVGDRFFRGSGTSQAAAVVSGAAALLIEQRPGISPDQVKALLMESAAPLTAEPRCQGAGLLDLEAAFSAPTPVAVQGWMPSSGVGSLELARGNFHVVDDGIALVGEQDIFLTPWDGASWSVDSLAGTSWEDGTWRENIWTGHVWTGRTWTNESWQTSNWKSTTWSGGEWAEDTWDSKSWSSKSWSGDGWSGKSWSSKSWSGDTWSSSSWGS